MKTFKSFLVAAMAVLPLMAAEVPNPPAPVNLQVGQKTTVMLDSNAGTGYVWQLADELPADAPVRVSLFGAVQETDSFCCGFPVPVTLTITGQKPGKALVRVVYVRPWEKGKAPAKQEVFKVRVTAPEAGK